MFVFVKCNVSEFDNIGVKNLASLKFGFTNMYCVIYLGAHAIQLY